MEQINKEILEQFEKVDFDKLFRDLLTYALVYTKIYSLTDEDIEDIIMGTVSKLLRGINKWDYNTFPNPFIILKKNVGRDISHEMKRRSEHKTYKNFTIPEEVEDIKTSKDLHEKWEIQNAKIDDFKGKWNYITDACKTDEEASLLLETMKNEKIFKRSEIAEYWGWGIDQVDSTLKRIRRKSRKI